ncbi:MAG: RNA polymerase sigma factor region1.1 domain-containing protein, partial [Bryobacteraceae bacterium]
MESGKDKGFALYDDVGELLPDEIPSSTELDELLV